MTSTEQANLLETVAAAFRSNSAMYRDMGSELYGCLFAASADEPELVELASYGQEGARPVHLLSAVHDLLLADSSDPLARFFSTLTDAPRPPQEAFPELLRFCQERRGEILPILQSRTVQSTYVERCWCLMPALAHVAGLVGEPLNLVEIGCSAGVLLTCDAYSYDVPGRGGIEPVDAPLTITGDYAGVPPVGMPAIGKRVGIDLHPLDATSPADRRWLLALCLPEFREQQARLASSLDVVARTDMQLIKGDALDCLPELLAGIEGPICVFHSVCLLYWPDAAKAALDELLCEAGRLRDIYRLGFELAEEFDAFHAGRGASPDALARPDG
ncbi:MAG: DUF2332 domain-containing protein, partial [Novosphingobium sp.]|nr:DUF2332 domain-containing protein [Novosphingobium sp.]